MKDLKSQTKLMMITVMVAIIGLISPAAAGASEGEIDIAEMDLAGLLDNIVLSASKHEETLEEAPANVFIVTSQMIENYGCRNIGEALSLVPGIYITDDYSMSQVGVRGISPYGDWNSHVMVLIDGRPINEQYGGTSSIDMPGVDVANLDRIEVIKGPASSLYGSNAFFGIINLITKHPDTEQISLSSRYYSGTNTKGSVLHIYKRPSRDLSFNITASFYDQNGSELFFNEFSDPNNTDLLSLDEWGYNQFYTDAESFTAGVAKNKNTMENFSTHSTVNYKDWSLTLHSASLNTGIAHSMWGSLFNSPENRFTERMHFVDLGYRTSLADNFSLTSRLSYNYYNWADYVMYNYYSEEVAPDYLPGPIWKDNEFNSSVTSEVKFHWDINDRNTFIFGSEVQFHKISHESGETETDGETIVENAIPVENQESDGRIYNLYAQDEHSFSDKVKFVGGLHFNYYTYTTGKVMPKGALIVNPYENGTYKFIASQGFRSPTFYELTFDDGEFYYANSDLDPELIRSYEGIVSHRFAHGLSVDMAANFSQIDDLILLALVEASDPGHPGGDYLDEVQSFRNAGEMEGTSYELSIKRNPVYRLSGFANVTYQKIRIKDSEQSAAIYNSPKWLGNFGLTYQLVPNRYFASVRTRYIASRYLWDESILEAQTLVDLSLRARNLFGWLDVGLGVKNVLDADTFEPLGYDYAPSTRIQRPGRSLSFSLKTTREW